MKLIYPYAYSKLERQSSANGRVYVIPFASPLPSVTTILSATSDKTFLEEWKSKVGDTEAARIVNEATAIGSSMHDNLEQYILKGTAPVGTLMSKLLTNMVIKKALCRVDEVWGTEVNLFTEGLYAGTADLLGKHDGVPAIMDFKNSIRPKKKEWIDDYFMQIAAYAISHNQQFGTTIRKGVIMIACRTGDYQEYVIEGDEFMYYEDKWLDKVHAYYSM